MSIELQLFFLVVCILASAAYSGSEIGYYSLSAARVDLEVRQGSRLAKLVQRLQRSETAVLITILIGNNVALELASHFGRGALAGFTWSETKLEIVLTLVLTPILFFFAEALPKDLFRRRPHRLVFLTAPFLATSRVVFWPLERLLRGLSAILEKLFRLEGRVALKNPGREAVLHLLAEGKRSGALPERAEVLAHNALKLRSIPIARAMRPWAEVKTVDLRETPEAEILEVVRSSSYSRLPCVDAEGQVTGYLHQIDVLVKGGDAPLAELRPLPTFPEATPVDRALARLRVAGGRVALVGSPEDPVGIVTLKDLLEEISGDLAAW